MPVRFNSQELIPAPFVNVDRSFQRKADIVFSEYTYTLTGTIVNVGTVKDSPGAQSYGTTMEDILAEQSRIRNLFGRTSDGARLEIETPDGGGPNTIDSYCTVQSVNFGDGTWVDRCRYTIVLKSTKIEDDDDETSNIQDFSEDWSINENEDKTWSLSHRVEARAALVYATLSTSNSPIDDAKAFVSQRKYSISELGVLTHPAIENFTPSGFFGNLDNNTNFWNYSCAENVDPTNYSYGITENFIYYPSGSTREVWSVSYNINQDNPQKADVSIDGTIFGNAGTQSNYVGKTSRAKSYFEETVESNLYTRLLDYAPSGYTLRPEPSSKQVSIEYTIGSLRYNYNYIAFKGNLITNAIDESISISDAGYTDIFAQIPVPGRANGPVVQAMNTVTLPERTVSINATIAISENISIASLMSAYLSKPDTTSIINALKPTGAYYYTRNDNEEYNPLRGQYSRSVSWVLQPEGVAISGIPTKISNIHP